MNNFLNILIISYFPFLSIKSIALPAFRPSCLSAIATSEAARNARNPEIFNSTECYHLNEALRCALKRLRVAEELYGISHEYTAASHNLISGLCFQVRNRKYAIYHVEKARLIYTGIFGPNHELTKSANNSFQMLTRSHPITAPVKLDDDVLKGLSKSANIGTHCDNKECTHQETITNKFKMCSRCRVAKYCSPECQKLSWSNHKQYCARSSKIQDEELRNDEYKQEQRRLYFNDKINTLKYKFGL